MIERGIENLQAAIFVGHRSVVFGRPQERKAQQRGGEVSVLRLDRGAKRRVRFAGWTGSCGRAWPEHADAHVKAQGDNDARPDRTRHS